MPRFVPTITTDARRSMLRDHHGASVTGLFTMLASLASSGPDLDIEVRDASTGLCTDRTHVAAGRRLEFTCTLPAEIRPAQVLLLALCRDGGVWLLSRSGLLDGDVWYHARVVIPRPDTLPEARRPFGSIAFDDIGPCQLLLICCRDRTTRIDKLALFERSTGPRLLGLHRIDPVTLQELEDLCRMLARAPADSWLAISKAITVMPTTPGGSLTLPVPRRSETLVSRPPVPAIQAAVTSVCLETVRVGIPPPQLYPFDILIPCAILTRLRTQSAMVRSWASETTEPMFSHDNMDAPVGRFDLYKEMALARNLYIGGAVTRLGLAPLTQMQGRIACQAHGLVYRDAPNPNERRWIVSDRPPTTKDHRDNGYLYQLSQNDAHYGFRDNPNSIARRSISKVDMALIAHCFQTPIEIWETWDPLLFDFWLERAKSLLDTGDDLALFAYRDIDYLLDYATETTTLNYFPMPRPSSLKGGQRGPIVEEPPTAPMAANVVHGFSLPLPAGFEEADVMMFQWDGDDLYLVSTPLLTDRSLRYRGEYRLPRAHHTRGGMGFAACEEAKFLALIVKPGALDLAGLPCYRNKVDEIPVEAIFDLRRRLFRLPISSWQLLQRTVIIG